MGDILSQSEIDALLNALNEGDDNTIQATATEAKKEAKSYDFKLPSKFSKEQLRTLEIIFGNYSRMVSSFMTGYLRTSVNLEVVDASQIPYRDFTSALSNPAILGLVNLNPLKGSIILEISPAIGYAIIDRILGGPGVGLKRLREFSEIEKVLLERIMSQMLVYLIEPWENVAEIRPKLEKLETNAQFAQIVAPTEMVALVTMSVKIGSAEGYVNFCIPTMVVDPVMERLNTRLWFSMSTEEDRTSHNETIADHLEKASITVSVVIGRTNILVHDFVHLQVGDIITLDSYINSDLDVMVGNLLKFNAKPGITRGKNAVQITSLIEKEE